MPSNVQKTLEIIFVEDIDEVLNIALIKEEDSFTKPLTADMPISTQPVN